MKTGVLALQGSYFDHVKSLELIDKEYTLIKSAKDLNNIDSLILPGGAVSYTHLTLPTICSV